MLAWTKNYFLFVCKSFEISNVSALKSGSNSASVQNHLYTLQIAEIMPKQSSESFQGLFIDEVLKIFKKFVFELS